VIETIAENDFSKHDCATTIVIVGRGADVLPWHSSVRSRAATVWGGCRKNVILPTDESLRANTMQRWCERGSRRDPQMLEEPWRGRKKPLAAGSGKGAAQLKIAVNELKRSGVSCDCAKPKAAIHRAVTFSKWCWPAVFRQKKTKAPIPFFDYIRNCGALESALPISFYLS